MFYNTQLYVLRINKSFTGRDARQKIVGTTKMFVNVKVNDFEQLLQFVVIFY